MFELLGELRQAPQAVIVTDCPSRSFPDMLLWVELGCGYRKTQDLQTGIRCQRFLDGLAEDGDDLPIDVARSENEH